MKKKQKESKKNIFQCDKCKEMVSSVSFYQTPKKDWKRGEFVFSGMVCRSCKVGIGE